MWLWRTILRSHMDTKMYCVSVGGLELYGAGGTFRNFFSQLSRIKTENYNFTKHKVVLRHKDDT